MTSSPSSAKKPGKQILAAEGRLPDCLIACVGGGSNAMGLFYAFMNDKKVKMVGVEAGGLGVASGKHAAQFLRGKARRLARHHDLSCSRMKTGKLI